MINMNGGVGLEAGRRSERPKEQFMFRLPHAIAFVMMALVQGTAWAGDRVACHARANQLELNACAGAELIKADKELNDVYGLLVKKMADDPFFLRKLRSAQRAWIGFRDAELEARFSCEEKDIRQCWGSMYPMSWSLRKAELTRARTKDLRQMLDNGLGQ